MTTIDILFPVLNEHLRLERGIRRTTDYILENKEFFGGRAAFSLTIVDNGSDDDTPDIARTLVEEFATLDEEYLKVRFIRLEERGVGIAFRAGVEATSSDIVGYMDIDLSTDIDYLKTMLTTFEDQKDIVYVNASRFARESDVTGRKWYRKVTSKGLLILLKSVFKMKSTDAICGFTFVRRPEALRLVSECSNDNGWFYMIEFLLRAERDGMKIYDMPIKWTEDYDTTVNIPKTVKNYLRNINRLRKEFAREDRSNNR
ncbi:glycosyltransferase [Butyrivibrio sp. CB08]|uniref:glycosyltransferase n=1 Tax=Butyrivibrio sp. CB08 TaxID=2364879 RepID=UPI000EA92379|nr:glycosyltransferase [Butyrivibrio sp. CB08]RKM57858.1 glycosyltransferase [Butyrivibrio sp. CB08]